MLFDKSPDQAQQFLMLRTSATAEEDLSGQMSHMPT